MSKTTKNIPKNIPSESSESISREIITDEIGYIAPDLHSLAVKVDSLFPDPANARKHDERNKEAVRGLLAQYGQLVPIVVDKSTRTIIKGNCTYEQTLGLGRKYIAVNFVDFTPGQALAFGMDDNRIGELGKWDYQVAADNIRELQEFEEAILLHAWSKEEVEPLLQADWQPSAIAAGVDDHGLKNIAASAGSGAVSSPGNASTSASSPGEFTAGNSSSGQNTDASGVPSQHDAGKAKPLQVTPAMRETIDRAIETLRLNEGDGTITEGRCIELICADYLALSGYVADERREA
jgi:hypothetical protein